MTIASDLFRTVTVRIDDVSQRLPCIVVDQADGDGRIIRFVPMDHGRKVTGFIGARLYYPPRSDGRYGGYVAGVGSDGAWDFMIPVGVLSVGRVGCDLSFIDGSGETYSWNVVFLVGPAVSGVFDPEDGRQARIGRIIGMVQDTAVGGVDKAAGDVVDGIGRAEASIDGSVTVARGKIYGVDGRWRNVPGLFVVVYFFYGFSGSVYFRLLFVYSDGNGEAVYVCQGWFSVGGRQWRELVRKSECQVLEAKLSD